MRPGNGPEERLIVINTFGKNHDLSSSVFPLQTEREVCVSNTRLPGYSRKIAAGPLVLYRTQPRSELALDARLSLTEFASSATARRKSTSAATRLSTQVLHAPLTGGIDFG